ncbi:MAG: DUF3450 domain-containing protein [Pseudohongiellaceae bacterium]
MNNRRFKTRVLAPLSFLALLVTWFPASAQEVQVQVDTGAIDEALQELSTTQRSAAEAQERINRLANQTSSLFEEFKRENDNLEALLVLNADWRRRIAAQEAQLEEINNSIANVQVVTREIPLLMEKMLAALEQFIEMDMPFTLEERRNRIMFARQAMSNPDVSIAERFRQVLVAYQNETQYGRTNATYPTTIEIDGVERDVNIVRIGRIALLFQTTDRQVTGAWNNDTRSWDILNPGEYRTSVQEAIRVVSNLDAPRILALPISAPESVQ